jgi:predicted amidohydrolase YtcJ
VANFEDTLRGSLEKGKVADFIVLDKDLMKVDENKILSTEVLSTYVDGKVIYKK